MNDVRCLVLCGGASRRMGLSKVWLPFRGEPLLQRVLRPLMQVGRTVVAAGPHQELPPLPPDVDVCRDATEHLGPLSGLATGLAALPKSVTRLFLSACDAPFLNAGFICGVIAALDQHDAAVPRPGERAQPLLAAYRVEGLLARIERLLSIGKSGLRDLLEELDVRYLSDKEIRGVDPNLDSLLNVNTPEDYAEALRRLD